MLSVLAYIYRKIANLRNALYDRGTFRSYDLGARTISIGNITAGGTGKTPLTAYVATLLAERGEKVCILTRGYGRSDPKSRVLVSDGTSVLANAAEAGDEPFELATKLLGRAVIVADADRVAAAAWARERFDITRFVLDDGFQHRRVRRDVDIVCVDAADPFGGDAMLPKGRLREPLENVDRALIIVVLSSDTAKRIDETVVEFRGLAPDSAVFTARKSFAAVTPVRAGGPLNDFDRNRPVYAFCGIGNPDSFASVLRTEKIEVLGFKAFPDHHRYSQGDLCCLEQSARAAGASALITTRKDGVKIAELKSTMPCYAADVAVVFDDAKRFAKYI
jgi:tetraacyldisaccharide 4'-kinase